MNFEVFTLAEKDQWSIYLGKLPQSQQDVYYTPEYYSLYENLGDGKAQCFVFEKDGEIAIYPFLINSVNDLGYILDKQYYDIQGAYGYNGVISSIYNRDFIKAFNQTFEEYTQKANIIAGFTRLHPLIDEQLFFKETHNVVFERKTIFMDLEKSEKEIFDSFQHSTKRQIKRASYRFGICLEIAENNNRNLNDLINIYHSTMIRAEATKYLYFNESYFKQLSQMPNSVQFIANLEEKAIGVIFGIFYKNYFHGHLSGSLKEYMHMSPSSFLYWEMFKYAKSKGCKILHLGGGDSSEDVNPLLKFKMNFSKLTKDFYVAKKIYIPEIYKEVVIQWSLKFPGKVEQYKNLLLKYRY